MRTYDQDQPVGILNDRFPGLVVEGELPRTHRIAVEPDLETGGFEGAVQASDEGLVVIASVG